MAHLVSNFCVGAAFGSLTVAALTGRNFPSGRGYHAIMAAILLIAMLMEVF